MGNFCQAHAHGPIRETDIIGECRHHGRRHQNRETKRDRQPDAQRNAPFTEGRQQCHHPTDAQEYHAPDNPGHAPGIEEICKGLAHAPTSPTSEGRASRAISSKESTGFWIPLAARTVWMNRRRCRAAAIAG